MPDTLSINTVPTHEQTIIVYDGPRTITTLTINSGIATFEKVSGDDSLSVTTNGTIQFNGDSISTNKDFLTVIIKATTQEGEEVTDKISFNVDHGHILDSANTQFSYSNSTKIITFAPVWTVDNKTPIYATETIVESNKEIRIGTPIQFQEFPDAEDVEGDTISYIIVDVEDGNGVSLGENVKNTFSISGQYVSYNGGLWNLEPTEIHVVIAAYDNENTTNIGSEKCRIRLAINKFHFPISIILKSTPPPIVWNFVNDFSGLIEYNTANTTLEYSFDNKSTWSTISTYKATETFNVNIRVAQDHAVTASKTYTKGLMDLQQLSMNPTLGMNAIGLGTSFDPYSLINYDYSVQLTGTLAENVVIEYTTDNEQTWSSINPYVADTPGAISFIFRYQDTHIKSNSQSIEVKDLEMLIPQQVDGATLIFGTNQIIFSNELNFLNNSNIIYSINGLNGPWYSAGTSIQIPYGKVLTVYYKFENTTTFITRTYETGVQNSEHHGQQSGNTSGTQDQWELLQEINLKNTINITVSDAATWSLNLNTLLEHNDELDWYFKIDTAHVGLSISDSFLYLTDPISAAEQRSAIIVGSNMSSLTQFLHVTINIEDQSTEPDVDIFSGVSNITDTTTIHLGNELNGTYVVYATPLDIYGIALSGETEIQLHPHIIKTERPVVNVVYDGNALDGANTQGNVKVVLTKALSTDVSVTLEADNGLQLGSNSVIISGGQTEATTTVTVTSFSQNDRELIVRALSDDNPYVIVGHGDGVVTVTGETTPPVITVIGETEIEIIQGSSYNNSVSATDNIEGDISDRIVIGGGLNIDVPGVYNVTYNVSDLAGNAAVEKTRTVTVKPAVSASPIYIPEKSVDWYYDLSNLLTVSGTAATWEIETLTTTGSVSYSTSNDDFVIGSMPVTFSHVEEKSSGNTVLTDMGGITTLSDDTAFMIEVKYNLTNGTEHIVFIGNNDSTRFYVGLAPSGTQARLRVGLPGVNLESNTISKPSSDEVSRFVWYGNGTYQWFVGDVVEPVKTSSATFNVNISNGLRYRDHYGDFSSDPGTMYHFKLWNAESTHSYLNQDIKILYLTTNPAPDFEDPSSTKQWTATLVATSNNVKSDAVNIVVNLEDVPLPADITDFVSGITLFENVVQSSIITYNTPTAADVNYTPAVGVTVDITITYNGVVVPIVDLAIVGDYVIRYQAIDQYDQLSANPLLRLVTVVAPPGQTTNWHDYDDTVDIGASLNAATSELLTVDHGLVASGVLDVEVSAQRPATFDGTHTLFVFGASDAEAGAITAGVRGSATKPRLFLGSKGGYGGSATELEVKRTAADQIPTKIAYDWSGVTTSLGEQISALAAGATPPTSFSVADGNAPATNATLTVKHMIPGDIPAASTMQVAMINISGLVAAYDGGSFTGTQWTDLSGAGNHAVAFRGGGGTVSSDTLNGHSVLEGTTSQGIKFPSELPTTYTLFHVTRYNGAKARIFDGEKDNWLSGFHYGDTGVAYHNGWVTPSSGNLHGNEWVLSTDMVSLFRSNGVERGTNSGTNTPNQRITINYGYNSQYSDWQVAEILVYDRELTPAEYGSVESYLSAKYGLAIGAPSAVAVFQFPPTFSPLTHVVGLAGTTLEHWEARVDPLKAGSAVRVQPDAYELETGTTAEDTMAAGDWRASGVDWNAAARLDDLLVASAYSITDQPSTFTTTVAGDMLDAASVAAALEHIEGVQAITHSGDTLVCATSDWHASYHRGSLLPGTEISWTTGVQLDPSLSSIFTLQAVASGATGQWPPFLLRAQYYPQTRWDLPTQQYLHYVSQTESTPWLDHPPAGGRVGIRRFSNGTIHIFHGSDTYFQQYVPPATVLDVHFYGRNAKVEGFQLLTLETQQISSDRTVASLAGEVASDWVGLGGTIAHRVDLGGRSGRFVLDVTYAASGLATADDAVMLATRPSSLATEYETTERLGYDPIVVTVAEPAIPGVHTYSEYDVSTQSAINLELGSKLDQYGYYVTSGTTWVTTDAHNGNKFLRIYIDGVHTTFENNTITFSAGSASVPTTTPHYFFFTGVWWRGTSPASAAYWNAVIDWEAAAMVSVDGTPLPPHIPINGTHPFRLYFKFPDHTTYSILYDPAFHPHALDLDSITAEVNIPFSNVGIRPAAVAASPTNIYMRTTTVEAEHGDYVRLSSSGGAFAAIRDVAIHEITVDPNGTGLLSTEPQAHPLDSSHSIVDAFIGALPGTSTGELLCDGAVVVDFANPVQHITTNTLDIATRLYTSNTSSTIDVKVNDTTIQQVPLTDTLTTTTVDATNKNPEQITDPPETQRTYTYHYNDGEPGADYVHSTLDSPTCWYHPCDGTNHMTIDAGVEIEILGILTKGREDSNQWVKTFSLEASTDGTTYTPVDDGNIFTGNTDRSTVVTNHFENPIVARYVRITTLTCHSYGALRAALLTRTYAQASNISLTTPSEPVILGGVDLAMDIDTSSLDIPTAPAGSEQLTSFDPIADWPEEETRQLRFRYDRGAQQGEMFYRITADDAWTTLARTAANTEYVVSGSSTNHMRFGTGSYSTTTTDPWGANINDYHATYRNDSGAVPGAVDSEGDSNSRFISEQHFELAGEGVAGGIRFSVAQTDKIILCGLQRIDRTLESTNSDKNNGLDHYLYFDASGHVYVYHRRVSDGQLNKQFEGPYYAAHDEFDIRVGSDDVVRYLHEGTEFYATTAYAPVDGEVFRCAALFVDAGGALGSASVLDAAVANSASRQPVSGFGVSWRAQSNVVLTQYASTGSVTLGTADEIAVSLRSVRFGTEPGDIAGVRFTTDTNVDNAHLNVSIGIRRSHIVAWEHQPNETSNTSLDYGFYLSRDATTEQYKFNPIIRHDNDVYNAQGQILTLNNTDGVFTPGDDFEVQVLATAVRLLHNNTLVLETSLIPLAYDNRWTSNDDTQRTGEGPMRFRAKVYANHANSTIIAGCRWLAPSDLTSLPSSTHWRIRTTKGSNFSSEGYQGYMNNIKIFGEHNTELTTHTPTGSTDGWNSTWRITSNGKFGTASGNFGTEDEIVEFTFQNPTVVTRFTLEQWKDSGNTRSGFALEYMIGNTWITVATIEYSYSTSGVFVPYNPNGSEPSGWISSTNQWFVDSAGDIYM